MYGMPGNRFGNMIKVASDEIVPLVKEAQLANETSRMFYLDSGKRINLTFDGMFLIDTNSGELVDEHRFDDEQVCTPVLS